MKNQKHIMVYISRHGQCNSWQVRRKVAGVEISRCFADRYLGGKSSALVHALSWRNKVLGQ